MNGFWKLTWIETKVFAREPLGLIGTLIIPVVLFLVLGRMMGPDTTPGAPPEGEIFNVAILAALAIAVSAVISLVAIISIYREGGILKRLRATPLSPVTILGAHVFVKLAFTVGSLALMVAVGRRIIPGALDVNLLSFTVAVVLSTLSILSMGFVIASVVPTARFAQPITAAFLYPMIAVSGLFFPIEVLPTVPRFVAAVLPTTHAVSLMQGIWDGAGWDIASAVSLVVAFGVCTAASTRLFRWE